MAIQSDYLSRLCTDNQIQIFEGVWGNGQNLNHRQISRALCRVVDLLVKKKWEELQSLPVLGAFRFEEACERIQKKFKVGGGYPKGFNYLALFRALNEEWGEVGVNISDHQLGVTRAYQNKLQTFFYGALNDASLMSMSERICTKFQYVVWHEPTNAVSIRSYLSIPVVQQAMSRIQRMNFSELGIRFVPIEIMYFSRMRELNLSHNQIDFLPDYIGNLKHLRVLDLEQNALQELPEDFPSWTHLEEVNLDFNPLNARGLEQYGAWKSNKAML